nr:hypothetical protein [Tanacetum cinerariifolium]
MGHFARECRAPKSQDRGRRENFKQGSKIEESAPKALVAIDGVGWHWSYMANEEENHALVANEEALTEFALMAKSSSENKIGSTTLFDKVIVTLSNLKVEQGKTWPKNNNTHKSMSSRNVVHKTGRTPMRTNRPNMNAAQPKRTSFAKPAHSYIRRPFQRTSTVRTQFRVPRVSTVNAKFPTVNKNNSTSNLKLSTADLGNKRKVVKASACWIWRPKQNTTDKGLNSNSGNSQNVIDDKGYWDSGCSWHMTGNISYLSDYEPYDGGYVSFGQGGGKITGKGDFKLKDDTNVLLRTPRQHNMYIIDLNNIVPHKDLTCLVAKAFTDESMLWHRRLGYLNFKTMNKLVRHHLVRGLPSKCFENDHTCVACLKGKQHKASCKTKLVHLVSKPLHTLHMDLFGPTFVSSLNHKWYCLVVTDDFSRFTWTFFLKTKDETSGILRNFITEIENLKELKVKIIRCDNKGEFRNKEMNDFCLRNWIKREFSNARTPQQNGVAERRNRTLIDATRTMLADAKLHVTFGAEGVNTACYVQNRVLVNKSQNKTPYELFNGRTPTTGFLKPFGCHVMILNTLDYLGKFDAKGDEGAGPNWLFDIDTLTNSMNYVPVVVAGTSSTNFSGTKDVASQDVKKDVSSLRYIALPNWFHEAHLESSTSNAQHTCNAGAPESSGNSNPTATLTNPLADQMETLTVETPIPTVSSPVLIACLDDSPEPSSNTRLISKRVTSQDDTPSLDNILTLSNRFKDILGVTTKTGDTNGVEADLGNMENNISASSTLTFRIHKDHPKRVRPIGTKWVLKNKKDERGIVIRNKARLVAQGHTQEEGIDYEEVFAPVARIEAIRLFLAYASFMGFTVYQIDVKSAFLYGTIDEEVYVMQPSGFQDPEFPVLQKKDGIFLSQDKYVGDILKKFGYSDIRSANTPIDKENPWGKDRTGKDVDFHLYRSMIGSLMYLTASRPDIMFVVCACARHQVTPKECHLYAVKRNFRYLKGHPKLGIWYPKDSPFDLVAYSDSDYGGATQDRKSTTRGCQFLGQRLISWQCKKQIIVATPTTEAEYVAAASGYGQVLWIQNQLLDYGYHFIRDCFEKKLISVDHIHTDDNVADLLTKLFDAGRFQYLVFWSTARIKTTDEGTKILATVDGKPRTISESSIRRNLKLNDEVLMSSVAILPLLCQGEACPTISGLEAGQDRANIVKTSTLPHDSPPRVTFLAADEGTQDLEIASLKARIKMLEDKDRGGAEPSGEDATIKGRSLETGEEASVERSTERGSNDTEELVNVLTSLDAGSILTSGVQVVSVPPTAEVAIAGIPTGSGMVPTGSPIFTTASVVTPYSRRKGKEKMVESDTPKKKKLQEQIDIQVAREMEEQLAREDQRMNEQITRDAEIAKIHAEEELQMLIDGLDRNNETIAKYLKEYKQFAVDLSIREKIDMINELVKYQDHYAKVLKYQSQQRKPLSKKQQREFYIRRRKIKRKGLRLEQESPKKMKTLKEVSKEDLKAMMQLGGHTAIYQFFVDMLKHFDKQDLTQLWTLVKETFSIRQATSDKEKTLWVKLKRLYEPDVKDQLWTHTQALMHDPVEWRLYDTCGVHHVLSRDQEIFMLVERDYPLRKGLAIVMISNKL